MNKLDMALFAVTIYTYLHRYLYHVVRFVMWLIFCIPDKYFSYAASRFAPIQNTNKENISILNTCYIDKHGREHQVTNRVKIFLAMYWEQCSDRNPLDFCGFNLLDFIYYFPFDILNLEYDRCDKPTNRHISHKILILKILNTNFEVDYEQYIDNYGNRKMLLFDNVHFDH